MTSPEETQNQTAHRTTRYHYTVVVTVVCAFAILAFASYSYLTAEPIVVDNVSTESATTEYALSRELPTRLRIPELSIDTEFEAPLELNEDGTISVPDSFEKVGWYKLGAAPGEVGTASILGHVDSYEGPAIFYSLGQLKEGDRVYVDRADGSEAVFEVERLERYKQDDFPTEEVYAPTSYPFLRLITCSGTYVHAAQRYTHNLVVYARLVEPQSAAVN